MLTDYHPPAADSAQQELPNDPKSAADARLTYRFFYHLGERRFADLPGMMKSDAVWQRQGSEVAELEIGAVLALWFTSLTRTWSVR